MKSTEYLSNDILEEEYLKSFQPFRVIQMILGSCRVDARDRFVTSPTKGQKMYTLFYILICTLLYASSMENFLSKYWAYQKIYYLAIIAISLHYATLLSNLIHVRFMNNESNVKFYINTQEIDRKLKIDRNQIINNALYNTNLATVTLILITILILFLIYLSHDPPLVVKFCGLLLGQITCILEWLYCSNLLIYFFIRLRFINAIIVNHLEGGEGINIENSKKVMYPSKKILRSIAFKQHDFKYSETDVYLKDIFDELINFQKLYRFQLFMFCFKFTSNTLFLFEYGILALQYNILPMLERIVLPILTVTDLLILIVICVRWEAFSREIKNTKYLCTTVLSLYYSGPLRKKAVKMLKMIKETPPQISVYDMWQMNASTMIRMINLITNLMVTLLQFALL